MTTPLQLHHEGSRALEIRRADGARLWRYVYQPETPANEAPRPYAHPVYAPGGDVLTNFRPNDHPWHHALSLTLAHADGVNFWGGPTYDRKDGYVWRENHGTQIHRHWVALDAAHLDEALDWCEPRSGRRLFHERRSLRTSAGEGEWSLRWTSQLLNVAGHDLPLGNYHSVGGLTGSHYTGLQFRGARELLDDHGDPAISITAEGDRAGETAVHGALANWMEWRTQHDGSRNRTLIRFENHTGPIPWFLRRKNPLAAFSFQLDEAQVIPPGGTRVLDHSLTFRSL